VINKCDLLTAAEKKEITAAFKKKKIPVDFISARENIGLEKPLARVYNILKEFPREFEKEKETMTFDENDTLRLEKLEAGLFRLHSRKTDKFVAMADFGNTETLEVFRRFLKTNGINDYFRKNGVQEGDIVVIGDKDFVFEDDEA
jgi:Obg family GTPase CgtA-like protein